MRTLRILVCGALLIVTVAGCANMPRRDWGTCAVAGGLVGGALGGVGGGVGVDQIERGDTSDGERAAGAGAGFVAGALLGTVLGHYLCDPIAEPPPVAEAPPPPPPGTEIVEIRGTHFAFDSARLTDEGKAILDEAVAVMDMHGGLTVRCEGHTDSIGTDEYNMGLGQRRADSVKAYLVDQGVSDARITTQSFGESLPAASNDTEEGRAQNRRVEIIAE